MGAQASASWSRSCCLQGEENSLAKRAGLFSKPPRVPGVALLFFDVLLQIPFGRVYSCSV